MIIGIDISSIPYGTGVSNYTLNLVKNLIKIDKTNTYKLFYCSLRQPLPPEVTSLARDSHVKIYSFRLPLSFFQFVWNQLHVLPIELFIGPCHVFHSSDWTQPPAVRAKLITTVHDLTPFIEPSWHHPQVVKVHARKMKLAARHCARFICVSRNTRSDLLHLFPQINPAAIDVIYEAAENKYTKFTRLKKQAKQKRLEVVRRQYNLKRFLLAQGTREPRKNLDRLISAFIAFKNNHPNSDLELAIAGKYGWGDDISTSPHPAIKILGYIPERYLVSLHAAALCLIYPSLYEGFGLPLVKAMNLGVPIITSNNSAMAEIAADCALLVNPNSTTDIQEAIAKIASSYPLRRKLSTRGLACATHFSWKKTANQTLNVYSQLQVANYPSHAHRN